MKHIKTFTDFLNESRKSLNDYEKSRDKILVGLKTNLLRDMLDRYDHEEAGDSIHFFDKKGNHFATLFDRGTRYQELRHNGTVNDKGWLTEGLNESWPFEDKKHITSEEEKTLFDLLKKKKTNILYNNDENGTGTVKDKRFQSDNEEKAWELFEIWASACTMDDLRMYLQRWTLEEHDDIFDRKKEKKMGDTGTEYLVSMMKRRSPKDVNMLKKIGFLI